MPDPQLFGAEVITTATWHDDTHNPVSSNAAAFLLISLARRYLPTEDLVFSSGPSSSQNMICSLSVAGDAKAEAFVDRVISNYLRRAVLTPKEKKYIRQKVAPGATLNTVLDRVVLTEIINGNEVTTDWYLPLREVFAFVLKALDDRSNEAWPVPEGSTVLDERKARFAELARVIKALAANPKLCSTGIRHALAQALDGYFGKRLPLNPTDLLLQSLRKFIDNIFQEQLSIRLPVDKDPTGEDRMLFCSQFQAYFLPWLARQKMPSKLWEAIEQAGGSEATEQFILNEFSAIGLIPDSKVRQLIKTYCLKSSLKAMPCDFIPFLASAQGWIARHAGFLNIKSDHGELTAKQNRVKLTLDWLATGLDIDRFYFLERLFDCYDNYQRIANLFVARDFSSGAEAINFSEASAWIKDLFSDPALFPSLLEAEDISPFIVHLSILEKACNQWRLQHYSDFIINFFSVWFAPNDDQQKALLFCKLAEIFLREQPDAELEQSIKPVLFVDDAILDEWLRHLNNDNSVDVHPYEINRILLHAICYLPQTWTPAFFSALNLLLRFIRNNFNSTELSINEETLKQSSYPEPLLNQMDQLIERYRNYYRGEPIIVINQEHPVLSPSHLQGVESYRVVYFLMLTPDSSPWLINTLLDPRFGFEVNAPNAQMYTPLCLTIYNNQTRLFDLLLKKGANPGLVLANNHTPLHMAISHAEGLLKTLLKAIKRFNSPKDQLSILKTRDCKNRNVLLASAFMEQAKFKLITRMLFRLNDRRAIHDLLLARDYKSYNILFLILNKQPTSLPFVLKLLTRLNDPYLISTLLKQRVTHDDFKRNILLHALKTGKIDQLSMLLEFVNQRLGLNDQLELLTQVDEYSENILMASGEYTDLVWNFFTNWLLTQAHPAILRALMNYIPLMRRIIYGRKDQLMCLINLYKQLAPADQMDILSMIAGDGNNIVTFSLIKRPDLAPCIIQLIHELPDAQLKSRILNLSNEQGKAPWQLALESESIPVIKALLNLLQTIPSWFIFNSIPVDLYQHVIVRLYDREEPDLALILFQIKSRLRPAMLPSLTAGELTSIKPYLKASSQLVHAYLKQRTFFNRSKIIHYKAMKILLRRLNQNEIRFGELLERIEQLHLERPDNALIPVISTLQGYVLDITNHFSELVEHKTRLVYSVQKSPPTLFKKQLKVIGHLPDAERQALLISKQNNKGSYFHNLLLSGLQVPGANLELLINGLPPQDRQALFKQSAGPVFHTAAQLYPQVLPLLLTAIKGMQTHEQLDILGSCLPENNILFSIINSHPNHIELILDALDSMGNPCIKAWLLRQIACYTPLGSRLLGHCYVKNNMPRSFFTLPDAIFKHVNTLPLDDQEVILREISNYSENTCGSPKTEHERVIKIQIKKAVDKLDRTIALNSNCFFYKTTNIKEEEKPESVQQIKFGS